VTHDEALKALAGVKQSMHDQFPDARARLEQLDAHMATVAMVVDHIHDEAERGQEA
jgi:hypothetical protein